VTGIGLEAGIFDPLALVLGRVAALPLLSNLRIVAGPVGGAWLRRCQPFAKGARPLPVTTGNGL
jgi:hypothetical protein